MNPEISRDAHFEALKDLTRLSWLLNFEAVATVPPADTALGPAFG